MAVRGLGDVTVDQISREVQRGARFVVYPYVISFWHISTVRSSAIQFLRPHESSVIRGLPFTLINLLVGWWCFAWGLIRTPIAIYKCLRGGTDVTARMLFGMQQGQGAATAAPPGQWPLPPVDP